MFALWDLNADVSGDVLFQESGAAEEVCAELNAEAGWERFHVCYALDAEAA